MPPRKSKPATPKPFKPLLREDEYSEAGPGILAYARQREQSKPLPLPMPLLEAIEELHILRCLPGDRGRALDDVIASGTISIDTAESTIYDLLSI